MNLYSGHHAGTLRTRGRALWTTCLLTWPAICAAGEPDASRPPPAEPVIELKHLTSTRIAYLEHQGPYWNLGRLTGQVAEYMSQHNLPGPMFARYLDDPNKVGVQGLRAEVGFFIDAGFTPDRTYQTRELGPRMVASLTIQGAYGRAPAQYPLVFAWAKDHGFVPDGTITEIYPLAPIGAGADQRRTEIQVALVGRQQAATDDQPPTKAPSLVTEHDLFAMRLVPPAEVCPDVVRDWLGQIVLRIAAIQQAVASRSNAAGSPIDDIAEPILARSDWLIHELQAHHASAPLGGPAGAQVLDGLDTLLVNVTLSNIEAERARDRLVELIQPVPELIREAARHRQNGRDPKAG